MSLFVLRSAVGLCWLGFVVVWLIAARSTKRTVERPPNQLGYRAAWVAAFALLYVSRPGRARAGALSDKVLPDPLLLAALGLALTIAGLALAFWARATLGGNWSGNVTFKENHTLVETGPYSFVRHPIYTAILAMFLGSALAYGTLGALVGFPIAIAGFVFKARTEEALMQKHFPEAYPSYRSRTRMLVPLVF